MKAGSLLLATPAGDIFRRGDPTNVRRRQSRGGAKRAVHVKRDLIQAAQRREEDVRGEMSAVKENGRVGDLSCSSEAQELHSVSIVDAKCQSLLSARHKTAVSYRNCFRRINQKL